MPRKRKYRKNPKVFISMKKLKKIIREEVIGILEELHLQAVAPMQAKPRRGRPPKPRMGRPPKPVFCSECGSKFPDKETLIEHIKLMHKKKEVDKDAFESFLSEAKK